MEPILCYASANNSCVKTNYPLPIRITLYLILCSAIILTVFGNILVGASIAYFKQLHTPTNYLILSLAVSDFLLGTMVMFPSMIRCIETCWYFGDFLCKVYMSADITLATASILNLSFISVDRYYAVCQPLLYTRKITVPVAVIMILVSWSVSALTGFGMIFLNLNTWGIDEYYYNHVVCRGACDLVQTALTSTVSSALSFYMPGFIMLSIYLKIFLVALRQARSIQSVTCKNSTKISRSQTKATKTLAVIMGTFLSSWTPFFICNVINPYINYIIPGYVFEAIVWLGYLNSTINPVIYGLFYSWFRKAIRLFLSGSVFKSDITETKLFTE